MPDRLEVNQTFGQFQSLRSPNRVYRLALRLDGNLVLFKEDMPMWATNTVSDGSVKAKVVLQDDGNLVLYVGERAEWDTGTKGRGNASSVLILKDDGNLTLVSDGKEIWSSGIGQRNNLQRGERLAIDQALTARDYKLTFTSTGHLCFTHKSGSSTYYYCERNISNAKYLVFSEEAALEFRDDKDNVLFKYVLPRELPPVELRLTCFRFENSFDGGIFVGREKEWSFEDLAKGSTPTPPQFNNFLDMNVNLWKNNEIQSINGRYKFCMQDDGNLVIQDGRFAKAIWAAGTAGRGDYAVLNSDGTLVVNQVVKGSTSFTSYATIQWTSPNTGISSNTNKLKFIIRNDGYGVILDNNTDGAIPGSKDVIWATPINRDGWR